MSAPGLPKNLRALLQEHTGGGFLLVKIDGKGNVENYLEYDNEVSYHAIMRKAAFFLDAMRKVDEQMTLSNLFAPNVIIQDGSEEEDDGEESGESAPAD